MIIHKNAYLNKKTKMHTLFKKHNLNKIQYNINKNYT